ncbi:MAG TPA: zf-HC2 domain-containing protein [Blastocatellia bacterium]|nr:zf-HC2 domain-containing protein [Blastocatellia bacterium]
MNCRRIEELIPLYVEDDLGEKSASDVRTHLQSCAACRALAAEYEASQAWLRAAEAPDFDEGFVDTIRAGVMRELAAHEAAPPFAERWRSWLAPRRLLVATAALLMVFAAVMFLVYANRSRVIPADEPRAEQNNPPTVVERQDDGNTTTELKQAARRPRRRTVHRPATPHDETVAQQAINTVPAALSPDRGDAGKRAETLRIEIQTADPNIRIIWFAPKPTDADMPNPMGETR